MARTVLLECITVVVGLFALVGAAEGLRRGLSLSREFSRKAVHFLIAVPVLFLPGSGLERATLIIVPCLFIPLLLAAVLSGRLKPLHAARRSYGTVFYALGFLLLVIGFYPARPFFLIVPMLVLCLGDSLAALPGERFRRVHDYIPVGDRKTVEGSFVMGLVSTAVTFAALSLADRFPGGVPPVGSPAEALILSAAVGSAAAVAEALSRKGSDNLSIPVVTAAVLWLYFAQEAPSPGRLLASGVLSALFGVASVRLRLVTVAGAMAMAVLGLFLYGLGGFVWTIPLLAFFASAGALSALNRRRKAGVAYETEKGGPRDALQVLANGGVPLLFFLLRQVTGNPAFLYGFLASAAAAAADTWATELGVFSRRRPVGILTGKAVERGMSGGVSVLGTVASAAGSLTTVLAGRPLAARMTGQAMGTDLFLIASACGFVGALFDSMLGATLQGTYRCGRCGKLTEKAVHCGTGGHPLVSGRRWMTNDGVNFSGFALAGILGAVLGAVSA